MLMTWAHRWESTEFTVELSIHESASGQHYIHGYRWLPQ